MSLHTGDLISTATPVGVGRGQMPPVSLRAGNEVRLGVEGLDEQRQRVAE
jgi:2,4-didehydro-3-deoxy-L-rhamnonate hydrolase